MGAQGVAYLIRAGLLWARATSNKRKGIVATPIVAHAFAPALAATERQTKVTSRRCRQSRTQPCNCNGNFVIDFSHFTTLAPCTNKLAISQPLETGLKHNAVDKNNVFAS